MRRVYERRSHARDRAKRFYGERRRTAALPRAPFKRHYVGGPPCFSRGYIRGSEFSDINDPPIVIVDERPTARSGRRCVRVFAYTETALALKALRTMDILGTGINIILFIRIYKY